MTESKFAVYALIERLRMKIQQLKHAVSGGDDLLVSAIDRDIQKSLYLLLEAHAATPRELHQQLRFFAELILNEADDAQTVTRCTDALVQLLDRSFRRPGSDMGRWLAPQRGKPSPLTVTDDMNLYQAMLDAMCDQIVLVGRDARIIYANRAFCSARGLRPLDCIGRKFQELQVGGDLDADFEWRLLACVAGDASIGHSGGGARHPHGDFSPVELQPVFMGRGAAIGAMIIIHQPVSNSLSMTN